MADELSAPLGRKKRTALKVRLAGAGNWPWARIGLGLVALILVGVGLRILLVSAPDGGRPSTTVAITSTRNSNSVARQLTDAPTDSKPVTITAGPETPTTAASGPAITMVPASLPETAPATAFQATPAVNKDGVLPDLVEETKDGPIPRISADGRTPFSAYQRPAPAMVDGKPRIAIVMTGMGLNEAGTLDAVNRLPQEISLAFAPYGKDLAHTVAAARTAGHEMLLEVPLEPFDYPETDPGPQTLLTGAPTRANLDKLYWLMARFGGYIGLINHTGARFTASASDFGPVMEELGTRGLGYLDDGSSNRSLAPELATANKVPFGRADIMLDANPSRAAILAALDALAAKARSNGQAIGVMSALPVSISTVIEWAQTVDSQGLQLVPVSALMK